MPDPSLNHVHGIIVAMHAIPICTSDFWHCHTYTLMNLSQIPPSCDQPSIDVVYSVEFPDPICSNSSDLPDVTISVRRTDKVITVLEEASATDAIYQLQVIYFGSLGFSVNGIGGVEATFEVNGCFWGFYIERPDGQIIPPDVGVSTFSIPSDNYRVILRYTSLNPTLEPRNQEELKVRIICFVRLRH